MKKYLYVLLILSLLFTYSCSSGPQRQVTYRQIREAESVLQQAQQLEAPVYAPETYLDAQLIIRKAKAMMRAEQYGDAKSLAQRAKKIGDEARTESLEERSRVQSESERLIIRGEEIWSRYDKGEERKYAPEAISDIKKHLDEGYRYLESGQYMDALDAAQKAHQRLAFLPGVVEDSRTEYLSQEKKNAESRQTSEQIIKAAQQKASQIIEEARKKAQKIMVEGQVSAAKARLEEFDRIYPSTYKVKKGETVIDIARRREIFNDQHMWPLIYKANRDQMRDPKVVFPGQVLAIQRDVAFEEIIEARKQAGAPPPFIPPYDAYNPEFYRRYLMIVPEMTGAAASSPEEPPSEDKQE